MPEEVMPEEGASISRRQTWLIRLVGMTIFIWAISQLAYALPSTHFEVGASRRHFEFDVRHGHISYAVGITMLAAAAALGIVLSLLQVFDSARGQRVYRIVSKVVGGVSIAAIALAYVVQIWRF